MRSPITAPQETPVQHGIIANIKEWLQPMLAWAATATATAAAWMPTVNQFLAAVLTLTTILWTLEKRRTEQARRKGYEQAVEDSKPARKSLLQRLQTYSTTPTPLYDDTYPVDQSHHKGKDA